MRSKRIGLRGIWSKIREKVLGLIRRRRAAKEVVGLKPPKVKKPSLEAQAVEQAKFFTGPLPQEREIRQLPTELPSGYGEDKLVLQTRDPWCIYAYWEVSEETKKAVRQQLGEVWDKATQVLRVYDVSHIMFDGKNAHRFFDINIGQEANSWYIDVGQPGRSWCVDLGLRLPNGEFMSLLRSNTAFTPIEGPSWITDEEWMIPEEIFAKLYKMEMGVGPSSPGVRAQ